MESERRTFCQQEKSGVKRDSTLKKEKESTIKRNQTGKRNWRRGGVRKIKYLFAPLGIMGTWLSTVRHGRCQHTERRG